MVAALLALYRGVRGTFLALRRGVVGVLLALSRGVLGTLLALYHGVTGTRLALRRSVVGALRALDRGMVRALLALDRRMVGALLALEGGMEGPLLALHRGVIGTLLALRRSMVGALQALQRGVVWTYVVARRTTSEVARWTWRSCASVIEGTSSIGISGVRVPVINVTLVAFSGGIAVGALVMWLFGVQPDLPRLIDRGVAPVAKVVASEPSADDHAATVNAAISVTIPVQLQGTAPSPVSGPMVPMSAAMTVTSNPAGARVTVNGIGWGGRRSRSAICRRGKKWCA